jgi:hypothetical protein
VCRLVLSFAFVAAAAQSPSPKENPSCVRCWMQASMLIFRATWVDVAPAKPGSWKESRIIATTISPMAKRGRTKSVVLDRNLRVWSSISRSKTAA